MCEMHCSSRACILFNEPLTVDAMINNEGRMHSHAWLRCCVTQATSLQKSNLKKCKLFTSEQLKVFWIVVYLAIVLLGDAR